MKVIAEYRNQSSPLLTSMKHVETAKHSACNPTPHVPVNSKLWWRNESVYAPVPWKGKGCCEMTFRKKRI